MPARHNAPPSLKLVGDPVNRGLGAALIAVARRAGDADAADGLLADLDRQTARHPEHVVDLAQARPPAAADLRALHELGARRAVGPRRVGLLEARIGGVRRRAVIAVE